MEEKIISPLSGKPAVIERKISVEDIVRGYKSVFGMDVTKYFHNATSISLCRCEETGYRFYHPYTLTGDSAFYESLEKFPWYYMSWKWEHTMALRYIKDTGRVLEVGCGNGSFVEHLRTKNIDAVGLELNQKTLAHAAQKRLPIVGEFVEEHVKKNRGTYDMVCSFQVLEHIAEVKPFLEASTECLKPGGFLIVSVPNNDSFIQHDKNNFLNMPPHHMGLWNEQSLRKTGKLLGLEVHEVLKEPLQHYHGELYFNVHLERFAKRMPKLKQFFSSRIPRGIVRRIMKVARPFLTGHSIMVVYKKTA